MAIKLSSILRTVTPLFGQDYLDLREICKATNSLFVDNNFPFESLLENVRDVVLPKIVWKRPFQIVDKPYFIQGGISRKDPQQGYLGDCWFISAAAALAHRPGLFSRVVPPDQSFDVEEGYAGIFHFRFWNYGKWYSVVIDDFLPVIGGTNRLWCARSKKNDEEFWVGLFEKAYAKFQGGYDKLQIGAAAVAMADMTGGIEQVFLLDERRQDLEFHDFLYNFLQKTMKLGSLMTASINPKPKEGIHFMDLLDNGLVVGHAFAVTAVTEMHHGGRMIKMIRVRNPWGNEIEWKGRWKDSDIVWKEIDDVFKERHSIKIQADGEFWMDYSEFFTQFDILEICHLSPDSFSDEILTDSNGLQIGNTSTMPPSTVLIKTPKGDIQTFSEPRWRMISFDGSWIKDKSGGRCGRANCSHKCYYFQNPQYVIELGTKKTSRCAMVVALSQKETKSPEKALDDRYEYIQARVYQLLTPSIPEQEDVPPIYLNDTISSRGRLSLLQYPRRLSVTGKFQAEDLRQIGNTGEYKNRREVSAYLTVEPGQFVIIPSTYDPNIEGDFLLRIFSEDLPKGVFIDSGYERHNDTILRRALIRLTAALPNLSEQTTCSTSILSCCSWCCEEI